MTQIIKVIRKLEIRIFDAAGIRCTYLSPAAETRAHPMALAVVGDAEFKLVLEFGPLRPRTDQAHLAIKHVQKLGQFVKPHPT